MNMILLVALGGALGSVLRYGVNVMAGRLIGTGFPWGTMTVNIVGSFVMGALIAAMALRWQVSQETRAFLTTGILGGFTTFSAFSLDAALLTERGDLGGAVIYVAGSVGLSLIAIFAGLWLMRTLLA
jgi:CrcB protein